MKLRPIESLSSAILRKHTEFAILLFEAVEKARRAVGAPPVKGFKDADRFTQANITTAIDLLARWAGTNDPVLLELFIGWVNLCANDRLNAVSSADFSQSHFERIWEIWPDLVADAVREKDLEIFKSALRETTRSLQHKTGNEVRILFIGDCLLCDIVAGLYGPCTRAGISLVPRTLSHRVPVSLRNEIRKLESQQFDVVFFSPFSHEFSSEYAYVIRPQSFLMSNERADTFLNSAILDTTATLHLLAEQFECPIYVHNTAGAQQHNAGISGLFKQILSARLRQRARRRLNYAINECLATESATNAHMFLVDEQALLSRYGAGRLGKVWFNSGTLHPTLLGSVLGTEDYFMGIYTEAYLYERKVIICDLDHTLWDGVIGEGSVHHFHYRQKILKSLKEKGLLLAINSKNDPAKVHWNGATLREDDFVCSQINWDQKTQNIKRIRDELNLKVKDFVFLDDRPDERERVSNAFPEIHVMDSMENRTWMLLKHWQRILLSQVDGDRTKLYRERVDREQFVTKMVQCLAETEDESAALKALGLCVIIREAERSDLKRVVELINRTNQFNLCGSRTTFRELCEGLERHRLVILAEAKDKFGSMGIVGILTVDRKPGILEIPIFVLSCRVFGFGIEHALLNSVKRLVKGGVEIRGYYQETPHNEPCRKVYSEAGFQWDGQFWTGRDFEAESDPAWLSVETRLALKHFWENCAAENS